MKYVFVFKQIDPNVNRLPDRFLDMVSSGIKKMISEDTTVPIISLPYGHDLQILNLDGKEINEVTVRYEDSNGNELTRESIWK